VWFTYVDCVVVDVLEYTGVIVDLSLEESWWRWCRTRGRVGRFQVETGRCAHSLCQSTAALLSLSRFYTKCLLSLSLLHTVTHTHTTAAISPTAITVCLHIGNRNYERNEWHLAAKLHRCEVQKSLTNSKVQKKVWNSSSSKVMHNSYHSMLSSMWHDFHNAMHFHSILLYFCQLYYIYYIISCIYNYLDMSTFCSSSINFIKFERRN